MMTLISLSVTLRGVVLLIILNSRQMDLIKSIGSSIMMMCLAIRRTMTSSDK
jgi:hypothetical protein